MDVPNDFNYETIKNYNLNLTLINEFGSPLNGMTVSVYQDTFLLEDKLIMRGMTTQHEQISEIISISTSQQRVTIRCLLERKTIEVQGDEIVCVFNGTTKQQASKELYDFSAKSLIGAWKFDAGSGSVAFDTSGDNDGTIYNTFWATGRMGSGLEFNSSDAWVHVPEVPIFDLEYELTYMAWVQPYSYKTAKITQKGDCDG